MLAVLASATFPIGTARCAAHSSLKGGGANVNTAERGKSLRRIFAFIL